MTQVTAAGAEALDEIYERYAQVPVLAELASGRAPVRPCGPLDSPFAVVGDAPGEDEERQGVPFAGRGGQLLRKMFTDARIPWHLCYLTHAVCWRPVGTRAPYPYQVQGSERRLREEIALAPREVVVTAGDVAWRCLTDGTGLPHFEEARFDWHELNGSRLLALPSPDYILRLRHDQDAWIDNTVFALAKAFA